MLSPALYSRSCLPTNMWCRACQQEVPGIAATGGARFRCARCGGVLASVHAAAFSARDAGLDLTATAASHSPLATWDAEHWEIGERLAHVRRVVEQYGVVWNEQARLDPAPDPLPIDVSVASVGKSAGLLRALGWLLLAVAIGALAFGTALAAWGMLQQRTALWDLGMPVALASQALLAIALVTLLAAPRAGSTPHSIGSSRADALKEPLRRRTATADVHVP